MRFIPVLFAMSIASLSFAETTQVVLDHENFDSIDLKGSIDVHVIQSDDYSVVVETEASWQQWVQVEKSGPTLTLSLDSDRPTGWFSDDYSVDIFLTMPNVEEVFVRGSGSVVTDNLQSTDVELRVDGSGEISVSALVSDHLNIEVNGSGDIKVVQVGAETVKMKVSGSGNVHLAELTALETDAIIRGSGDIKVSGALNDLLVSVYGSGDFDGKRLRANDIEVTIYGSGDVWLDATSVARATVRGSGDIHLSN